MTGAQIAPQVLVHPDMSLALAEQLLRGVRDAATGAGTERGRRGRRPGRPDSRGRQDGRHAHLWGAARHRQGILGGRMAAPTDAWAQSTAPGGPDWG